MNEQQEAMQRPLEESRAILQPGKKVSFRGLYEASAFIIKLLRYEERILILFWLAGMAVIVASGTGVPNFGGVFLEYFRFFSGYMVVLFFLSRWMFRVGERWNPENKGVGRRIKFWLWLQSDNYTPDKADLIFTGKAPCRLRPDSVLAADIELVRCSILLFINLSIYSNIKTRLPFFNGITTGDSFFHRADTALVGKNFITTIEHWFSTNPDVASYFTTVYMHGYFWFILLVAVLYFRHDLFSMRWLFISVCLTYMASIIITALYPSAGPCFVEPERFAWLKDTPIGNSQRMLADFYSYSKWLMHGNQPVVSGSFLGIAAFPSLHVGHMVIILLVAARTIPILSIWMLWITAATFIATIGFGWHYAVDGIAGLLIAVAIAEGTFQLMKRIHLKMPAALKCT